MSTDLVVTISFHHPIRPMPNDAPFRVGDRVVYQDGSRAVVSRVRWAPAWWMIDIDWDDNYWDHLAWNAERFYPEIGRTAG